jgi:uncharacterized protein (DUF2147 family)
MKQILIAILFISMATNTMAQDKADKIVGTWYSPAKEGKVLIYKKDGKYYGKLIFLKNAMDSNGNPVLDTNNPDTAKRNLPLIGVVFITDLIFDESKNKWIGKLYDYDGASGNTYPTHIRILKNGTLNIRGFWGLSFFGLNRGLILSKVEN